jgi:TetR/AcrR family transcriptional regulator, cholesterol catabolism regulator
MGIAATGDRKFDRKLDRVLLAAARVFADEGYDRASIRSVADHARLSVAGLYYYVRSKDELLYLIQYRVFDSLVERFKRESAALDDPEEKLHLLVRNHLERFVGNLAELVVCSRELGRLTGDLQARIEAKQREYFGLALGLFAGLKSRHGSVTDPRTAALCMFGSINWVHTWYRPRGGLAPAALARDFVHLVLRGYLPPGTRVPQALLPRGRAQERGAAAARARSRPSSRAKDN